MTMLERRLRRAGSVLVLLSTAACSSASTPRGSPTDGESNAYLSDAQFRRSELVASLVNPNNGYSALRLAHYDTGDGADWSALPEWNPRSEVVAEAELDAPGGVPSDAPLGSNARSATCL
jgi:hypothetical protein